MGMSLLQDIFRRVTGRGLKQGASFDAASYGLRPDRMLNYVWIDKEPLQEPCSQSPLSSVPLHYLDKAFDNARRYGDTMVNIWIDYTLLNKATRFMVESHTYFAAPENVFLRDLNDIPRYRKSDLFKPFDKHGYLSVWQRSDLARFFAVDFSLSRKDVKRAFYADFDMEDVDLDNPVTDKVLKDKGLAFAAVGVSDVSRQFLLPWEDARVLAHGYIAMERGSNRKKHLVFMHNLEEASRQTHVFEALKMSLVVRDTGVRRAKDVFFGEDARKVYAGYMTNVVIPPIGTIMERPQVYNDLNLCGLTFRGG